MANSTECLNNFQDDDQSEVNRDNVYKHYRYHDIKSEPVSGELIVMEKVHGSNFAIGYINNSLQLQSRNRIIDKDFNPFGLPEIIEPLIDIVKQVKNVLPYNFLIYGEIFGKTFQKMEYYDLESVNVFGSKEVFFRAFDLYNVDEHTYLKYSDAVALFLKVGLPHLPILNINYQTINDLYVIVDKYQSAFSIKCVEGFVLKKDETEFRDSRTIFKVKNKEFREKNTQFLNKNSIKVYINYNRFESAYSKIGDDSEKIKEEMIRDSIEDMMKVIRNEVKGVVEEIYPRFKKKYDEKLKCKEKLQSAFCMDEVNNGNMT